MAPSFNIRTRKVLKNPCMDRVQMIVDVLHPGQSGISKDDIATKLASQYKVGDSKCVVIFGLQGKFGGGQSTGFALIYSSLDARKKNEPKYRLKRQGLWDESRLAPRIGRRNYKKLKRVVKRTRCKKLTAAVKNAHKPA